jgi:PPOX class probable F420-dependent enzyme
MTEAMGHGVNQRKAIQMTPAEVDAFLAERRNMTMCSLSPDGSIHAVAMWYGFLEGCITVETKAKSQKVRNLRRNPHLTVLFEDGDYYEELRGVELVGQAEIVDDPDRLWQLGISVFERYNGPYTDELKPILEIMLHKRVAVKRSVGITASWDCRRRDRRREIQRPAGGGGPAGPGHGGVRVSSVLRGASGARRHRGPGSRPPRSDPLRRPAGSAVRIHRLALARRAGGGGPRENVVDHSH